MKLLTILLLTLYLISFLGLAYFAYQEPKKLIQSNPFLPPTNPIFPPPPNGYDTKMALDLLYYSKVSYCSKSSIESWSCGASCNYQ